jgi:hypothetical protein
MSSDWQNYAVKMMTANGNTATAISSAQTRASADQAASWRAVLVLADCGHVRSRGTVRAQPYR